MKKILGCLLLAMASFSQPIRVSACYSVSDLIVRIEPVYPPLAKSSMIQGDVKYIAVVNKSGQIKSLNVVDSDHPLLEKAAREAVTQWRWQPTRLNGKTIETTRDIIIRFVLSGPQ